MISGKRHEVHLCEQHAREAGYALPSPQSAASVVGHLMAASSVAKAQPVRAQPVCACCRLTFHQFKQTGLLGCAECYKAFGDALAALIERTQSAAVHHVGKVPRRCGGDIDIGLLRQRLARELDEAVKAEQYERAVKLRDRLRALEAPPPAQAAAAPQAPDCGPNSGDGSTGRDPTTAARPEGRAAGAEEG